MDRREALRTLGLGEDATTDDIKTAYKESAQILHPDKFANNKKLQERATEQFKNLQEAYDYLTSGSGAGSGRAGKATRSGSGKAGAAAAASGGRRTYTREDQLRARIAGIDAARAQLVAQRDSLLDQRRRGAGMAVVGALLAFFFLRRIPWVGAIGSAAAVWGIVDLVTSIGTLQDLDEQLAAMKKQKRTLLEQLEGEE